MQLKDQDVVRKFQDELNLILESVEDKWKHLNINKLKATEVSCGLSENRKWCRETWYWDSSVSEERNKKGEFGRFRKMVIARKSKF